MEEALQSVSSDSAVKAIVSEMQQPFASGSTVSIWRNTQLFQPEAAITSRDDASGHFWRRFRNAYRYGIQGIAVSSPDASGTCSVVVAEPPPHVSLENLRTILPDATVFRQQLGHDGALFDVVGTLSGDAAAIGNALRKLNKLLYWTDYKAFVYKEPFKPNPLDARLFKVNVDPTAKELLSWVSADGGKLTIADSSESITYDELRKRPDSVVCSLDSKDLVLWWIPTGTVFENCVVQARQFALDSDLIVGAIQSNGLVLCARKRVAPYDVLPPLRVETLALLASVKGQAHLFQTYNDCGPGAGDYDAEWNWSSITMSPELLDTEYGDLLNVADQTIKGWSEAGETVDQGFENYPKPADFPFNNRALSDVVNQDDQNSSVTFNWNTKGSGHAVAFQSGTVYSPGVTGSLSVSYISGRASEDDSKIVRLEEEGYKYFSTRGDATITRVNQYTIISQIFHNLSGPSVTEPTPKITRVDDALIECAVELIKKLDSYDESDIPRLADGDPLGARYQKSNRSGKEPFSKTYLQALLLDGLNVWQHLSDEGKSEIGPSKYPSEVGDEQLNSLRLLMYEAGREIDGPEIIDARTRPDGKAWVHTQAIAFTNSGPNKPDAIGGHNLDMPLKTYKIDEELGSGEVRVADDGSITVSKDFESKIANVQRDFDRGSLEGESITDAEARLKGLLDKAETVPERSADTVLGSADLPEQSDGFKSDSVAALPTVPKITPPADVANVFAASADSPNILVVKSGDYFWIGGRGFHPVPTNGMSDAVDATIAKVQAGGSGGIGGGGEPPNVEFKNFDSGGDEWKSFMGEVRRKGKGQGLPDEVLAIFGKAKNRINLSDYDIAKTKIEVGEVVQEAGRTTQTIDFKLQPKVATLKETIIRIVIKFHEKATELTRKVLGKALAGRWAQISTEGAQPGADAVQVFGRELRRLQKMHDFDFEITVTANNDDWRIAENRSRRLGVEV